ncbi:MAG: nicotinate phosphoribosyltransferase [Coriobacteriales bacterium]|jgi:nicotinate phosphoribosyltransferase|nr:nicotinate phosphoribosyltransferase [Coriobacteriales bacterium]
MLLFGNQALLTDLYQLTMAEGYWREGIGDARTCFYMHFRELPFNGGYAIACGMSHLAEYVRDFAFTGSDIDYLASIKVQKGEKLFSTEFLHTLKDMRLKVDIHALSEGTLVFAQEPLVRVSGPVTHCQLLETALLNIVNFETLIATKAARICEAAKGPVAEFGLRRAQGPAGGLFASRAAYVGGCASTSNVLAGKHFDIPVSGTHAHSWVMAFKSELEAFRAYARSFPQNCTLLVDTYDVISGINNAITVAHEMSARGESLAAIRIDSGDLAWLSKRARQMLDDAGLPDVKIVASNDLDEFAINSLIHEQESAIDCWGVGTRLATGDRQPSLGGVYKMCAQWESALGSWIPKLKVSEQVKKATLPGYLNFRRYHDAHGMIAGDMVYDECHLPTEHRIVDPFDDLRQKDLNGMAFEEMLKPLVINGKPVNNLASAKDARLNTIANLARLDATNKRLMNPHVYPVGLSFELRDCRDDLIRTYKGL